MKTVFIFVHGIFCEINKDTLSLSWHWFCHLHQNSSDVFFYWILTSHKKVEKSLIKTGSVWTSSVIDFKFFIQWWILDRNFGYRLDRLACTRLRRISWIVLCARSTLFAQCSRGGWWMWLIPISAIVWAKITLRNSDPESVMMVCGIPILMQICSLTILATLADTLS